MCLSRFLSRPCGKHPYGFMWSGIQVKIQASKRCIHCPPPFPLTLTSSRLSLSLLLVFSLFFFPFCYSFSLFLPASPLSFLVSLAAATPSFLHRSSFPGLFCCLQLTSPLCRWNLSLLFWFLSISIPIQSTHSIIFLMCYSLFLTPFGPPVVKASPGFNLLFEGHSRV